MKKIKIEANEQDVLNFVKELKKNPILEGYDINALNANDFALFAEEQRNCSKCNGLANCKNTNQGYMLMPENNTFVFVSCKYKKEVIRQEVENQKIKTLFISKSILAAELKDYYNDTPNRKEIYEFIISFLGNYPAIKKGLYLYGDFATGKTFILGCIANELAKKGIESLIIYFPDLVVELKNAIGTSRFEELINYLKSVDVLLLDDLGSENMTPWLRDEILGPILNYRLMEEKPVFISSNINPNTDDLVLHYSITKSPAALLKARRIHSRLKGLIVPIELDNSQFKR